MKVLYLTPIGHIGGAERVLLTALTAVRAARPDAELRVVCLEDGPLLAAAAAAGAGTEVVAVPRGLAGLGDSQLRDGGRSAFAWAAARAAIGLPPLVARLRTAVRRFGPDLVHSTGVKTHLLGRLAVPRRVPVVWHAHDFYGLRPAAGRLLRRAAGRTKRVVAISDAVAADVRSVLPGVPVTTVFNAVDTARFAPGPADPGHLDRLAGLPAAAPGTLRAGLVATYARWKGHRAVLAAAARLAADPHAPPVRWYLVGGPIYHTPNQVTRDELQSAAAALGLSGRVGLIPFQPDPAAVYRSLDVVVHASTLPEPFGLTVAEAMSCGRAVVVSAAGGAAELFTDGYDALGVTPGDAAGLAAAVQRLAGDPALRDRIGAAARGTALSRFDATRYGPQLLAAYDAVMADRPDDHPPG